MVSRMGAFCFKETEEEEDWGDCAETQILVPVWEPIVNGE